MTHVESPLGRTTSQGQPRQRPAVSRALAAPATPTDSAAPAMPAARVAWLSALRECVLVVMVTFFYFLTRGLISGREDTAVHHARDVLAFERRLHIDIEPTLQRFTLDHHTLSTVLSWTYLVAHLPVLVAVAIWLYVAHRSGYRWFRNAFLISAAIGLTCYVLFPVAPPRFMPGFVDVMEQDGLGLDGSAAGPFYNPYAAMPSLHVGWSFLAGVMIVRYSRRLWLRALGALLPLAMAFSVLGTGNHYLLDIVVGVGIVIAALVLARSLAQAMTRRQERPTPA